MKEDSYQNYDDDLDVVFSAANRDDGDTVYAIGSRVNVNVFNTIARCHCGKYIFIPEQLSGGIPECIDCAISKIEKLEKSQTHINMLTGLIQMRKAGY